MKLLISTGDYFGDCVGGMLIRELRKLASPLDVYGIGGSNLKSAGAEMLEDSSDWSSVGIFDALKKVPRVLRSFLRLKKKILELKPHGVAFIDCPAFNVPLAKAVRKANLRSVYFFPPSAWRGDSKRAAQVGKWVNLVIAPFQETAKLYAAAGVPTFFSGHPVLDWIHPEIDKKALFREFNLDVRNHPVIGLLPGSRDQEIDYLLPLLLDTVVEIRKEMRHPQFLLPIARAELEPRISKEIQIRKLPIEARVGINYKVMQIADLLIVASGTATLEGALFEKPMIIVYKVSPWTWRLERPFLAGAKFAGLPNLLAGKQIVPEFIQEDANAWRVAEQAVNLIHREDKRAAMIRDLQKIREQLGTPGVLERVAKQILETFRD